MYDISLQRFNDEFGFLTFPRGSNPTPTRSNFTVTSKGVFLNQWRVKTLHPRQIENCQRGIFSIFGNQ